MPSMQEIMDQWKQDVKIDNTRLDYESTRIDAIKIRYIDWFAIERLKFKKLVEEQKVLKRNLYNYYSGDITIEECRTVLKREPPLRAFKSTEMIKMNLEADSDYIEHALKINMQEEKLTYLHEVLSSLNQRGFKIKDTIAFLKYKEGHT